MSDLQKITEEQMDAVGVCSAPDVLSGSTSENKAVFDKMVRQLVAPAYNAAVDAIEAINQTETGVEAAEAKRAAAEAGRVEAEAGRVDAEAARVRAEQDRQEAEQARSDGESARQKAENAREEAEQTRAAAEKSRIDAEAARRQAEQQRVDSTTGIVAQATGQAKAARDSAVLAQSWAVGETGTREGENTDNARYWAQQAHMAAGGGVVSFNGRTGSVMPQKGDYTAADVGAAPSGFGWGERVAEAKAASAQESQEDYCARLEAILSNMPDTTAALIIAYPPELYGRAATTISILYKGSDEYATLFNCGAAESSFNGWRMYKEKGVWSPFEWVNPPMKLGVEYRTTERWDQKPVYCIAWPGGAFPNNTNKTVEIDTGTAGAVKAVFAHVVLANGTMVNGMFGEPRFSETNYIGMFLQNGSAGKFSVYLGSKREVNYDCTIFIKYTRG